MRKLFIIVAVIIIGSIGTYVWTQTENGKAYAISGYLVKQEVEGNYRNCIYRCNADFIVVTVRKTQLCQLWIECP